MSEPVIISRADAKAAGLATYFTGKACVHGHLSPKYVAQYRCVECCKAYDAQEKYRAARRANNKKWSAENKEKNASKSAKWRAENPDRHKELAAKWRKANPEKIKAINTAQYEKNKVDRIRKAVAYTKANPDKVGVWQRTTTARRRAAGKIDSADVQFLRSAQKHKCAYCKKSVKTGYHVDHIKAVSKGGTSEKANLQILCGPCNLRKNAKDPITFAQSIGLLI